MSRIGSCANSGSLGSIVFFDSDFFGSAFLTYVIRLDVVLERRSNAHDLTFSYSVINISGGSIGNNFDADTGSRVRVFGGAVGELFGLNNGSELIISGGTFGDGFTALSGSSLDIFGTEFFLDGEELDSSQLRGFIVTDRDITLSGVLLDGESFSFDLNSIDLPSNRDFFALDSILTITAVPEPSSAGFITLVIAMGFAWRRRKDVER